MKITKEQKYINQIENYKIDLCDVPDCEQTEAICLAAVKRNGWFLEDAAIQTVEICLEAVRGFPMALEFAEKQTDEICLEAIAGDIRAMDCVRGQTEELCLEAIKINPWVLRFIKNQTDKVCLAAIKNDGMTLFYVKNKTEEICLAAVKRDGMALKFIKNQTNEIQKIAIKSNILSLFYVDVDVYQYSKNDILKAYRSNGGVGSALEIDQIADILNKLNDEQISKSVLFDLAEIFNKDNLEISEKLRNVKAKVDMLEMVKKEKPDKINNNKIKKNRVL